MTERTHTHTHTHTYREREARVLDQLSGVVIQLTALFTTDAVPNLLQVAGAGGALRQGDGADEPSFLPRQQSPRVANPHVLCVYMF